MSKRHIIWMGLVVIAGGSVLHTSLQSREQEDQLAQLNREIAAEQDRIRVLTAEWHSLKTPERIEALTRRHLPGMERPAPTQLASLTEIPDPLPTPVAPVAVAEAKPEAAEKPVVVARAEPKPAPTPPRRAATPAAVKPQPAAPRAEPKDELAALIARSETSEVKIVTEPRQPQGVLWASMEDLR